MSPELIDSSVHDLEPPVLSLKDLSYRYGSSDRGIFDCNVEIHKGERVALLGLNGAGKSTTFRAITGLLPAQSGRVLIGGVDLLRDRQKALSQVGYLSENAPLPLELTPRQHLMAECRLRGVDDELETPSLLVDCELEEVVDRPMFSLSRGFRKRVGLAASLCHRPSLLLLDEPTAGLDPHQVDQFRKLISKVSKRCAVLISTHVLAEVEALCQRCLIVHHGQLKAEKALPIQGDGRYLLEVHCSEVEGVRELPPAFESIMKGSLENEAFAKEILQKETWESDWLSITTPPLEDPSAWLKERIVAGWSIRSFAPVHLSLEQEFLKAIGDAPS